MSDPPKLRPLPVKTHSAPLLSFFIIPAMKPISRAPTPMSPAGTSRSAPMWRNSSATKAWQKRMTSPGLVPLGSEAQPALVGADRRAVLHAIAALHLDVAAVVDPGDPEDDDPLRLDQPVEQAMLGVAG